MLSEDEVLKISDSYNDLYGELLLKADIFDAKLELMYNILTSIKDILNTRLR